MPSHAIPRRLLIATWAAAAGVLAAGAGGLALWRGLPPAPARASGPMLIAPMVGAIEPCIRATDGAGDALAASCAGPDGSAAALLESTLHALEPAGAAPTYPVGYTLPVPLLGLFQPEGQGWAIDQRQVDRLARTVRDSQRPLILYLFSTHFAAQTPIEAELARDPANLAATRDGPLPPDRYYEAPLYNWSFARTDNPITQRREQAIAAVLDAVCRLDAPARARIQGVTLLGELHHLFPNFQAGMGFDGPYRVSDYSAASVAGFRAFLRERFADVAALNRALDSDYRSFDEVQPPARDIRTEPLTRYTEHIDAFAHGTLPVSGWLHVAGAGPQWLRIYRDGALVGRTRVGLSRQDVLAAKPEFGTAEVGWRWDMDFRRLPAGLHRIDVLLERADGAPVHLGTREIAIMDKRQRTPTPAPQAELPAHRPPPAGLPFHIDQPHALAAYYYNPLVPLWHAFRGDQVVRYLQHFDAQVARSCLAGTPRYTHQIVPFANPGWDANKFAIDASLQPATGMRLGVSLYGEATDGTSFFEWHARHGGRPYGVTEFHPLRALPPAAMQALLARHAAQGAQFLSFFLEPRWNDALVERDHNIFSFDPDNPRFGSDQLYRSTRQALAQPNSSAAASARP
ncbi:hypothetical protein [Pseudorhodoferax sp.]|uniref:hypothetical protein n=1 Tax=Pseudorhodoferax sp. TaxID=1993553 RepID=UPI002DD65064|nr:hypothetical protein [Pseudorhodoferax sp.]